MADVQPSGKCSHRFWQRGGGYDRNIRTVKEMHEKIAYIHANPVRRGLVERVADWPWSSWRAWDEGIDDPLSIDRESLPPLMI
jgi:putative transposase